MNSRPPPRRAPDGSSLRRARSRLAALLQLDNLGPALIVAISIAVSFEPKPFGIEISDRHVILALFALLGADAVIERSGRLNSLDSKLDALSQQLIGPISASRVLRTRASFERMDVLLRSATRSITIVGINLEGAVIGLSPILGLARTGGTIKLLAMDPDGVCIAPSAAMSRVDPEIRRQKIRQNLNLIKNQLLSTLSKTALRHISLCTVDALLPISVIAIDQDTRQGSLIAQHHLTATAAEWAPMLFLSRKDDSEWFQRYLGQSMDCFMGAHEWQG
jgi:hypothetical protein